VFQKRKQEIFKWLRGNKKGKRKGEGERVGERREKGVASTSGDERRLTLYSGCSVISHKGSLQFSKQTDDYKVLRVEQHF